MSVVFIVIHTSQQLLLNNVHNAAIATITLPLQPKIFKKQSADPVDRFNFYQVHFFFLNVPWFPGLPKLRWVPGEGGGGNKGQGKVNPAGIIMTSSPTKCRLAYKMWVLVQYA